MLKRLKKNLIGVIEEVEKCKNLEIETQDELNEKMKSLNDNWKKEEDMLSIFIEHDELEKVSISCEILKENLENSMYEDALEAGAELIFWLDHFKDKDILALKTFF